VKTVFINWKGPHGRETIDEITRGDDAPEGLREFRAHVRGMLREYALAGMAAYTSRRPCRGWRE
jgi:hypothetical protein